MIARARRVLPVLVLLVLFVAAMAALALSRFVEDPVALVLEIRETVSIPLPGSGDRILVERAALRPFGWFPRRALSYERAGQRSPWVGICPQRDAKAPLEVFFLPLASAGSGPFVLLGEPGVELVLDLRQGAQTVSGFPAEHLLPGVHRFVRTPFGPFLTAPGDRAVAGIALLPGAPAVITHGRTPASAGLPLLAPPPDFALPSDTDPGRYRLGAVTGGYGTGQPLTFVPSDGPL
ncbi:hypothetical protein IHV25_07850 [Phaeovibrio sulfidiphilus]|uniref:Uncharacterized protein n=1 Tax=Phaeovibrio sulfidiphilus TaxID=1220600 RepID=A0A8J6YW66_9PROT|nr:hypothetical protein [Phaeovibrio sulfidiphilus]MBE1237559.1 hypothetical protein [Phaeovibrio sulfidiphilus]